LRLRQIIENHRIVKKAALKAHPASFSYYTVLIQSIALVYEIFRLSDVVKPIANILISNVPGPMETRYFKDCQLDAVYPISTITPGGGVNITLLTYDETANIGLVCCSRDIDNLEPMAQYFHDAFDLLESSVEDSNISIDDIGEHVVEKKQVCY
jgi:diacylglycerol O-acyltransferase / wax synthase